MNRKHVAFLICFFWMLIPTIVLATNPVSYGQVIGRVSEIDQFTVLMNQVNGTHKRAEYVGYGYWSIRTHHDFFWKWDNFTTPEGMPVAVSTVKAYDIYEYFVEDRSPPSALGFFFDNWTTSYDAYYSGSYYYTHSWGSLNVIVWSEPYYNVTVEFEYLGDSWSEVHSINQSTRDTLGVGSLLEFDSSRVRVDYPMYALIPWAIGWIGIVATVGSVRRR